MGWRDVNRGHAKTKETECIRGFGEPDGKTGGNDGVGCVGEVICIYPYVPLNLILDIEDHYWIKSAVKRFLFLDFVLYG